MAQSGNMEDAYQANNIARQLIIISVIIGILFYTFASTLGQLIIRK